MVFAQGCVIVYYIEGLCNLDVKHGRVGVMMVGYRSACVCVCV